MTSESLFGIQAIRDYIVQDADIWSMGVAPAYIDNHTGDLLYRPNDDKNEYEFLNPSDKFGNWFYIRYRRGQAINHSTGQFTDPVMPDLNQVIPLRMVGVFRYMDYYEVLDRVINRVAYWPKSAPGMQFQTARNYQTEVINSYIDVVGQFPDETDNRFISYGEDFLTIGIDFDLNFTRTPTKCRPFINSNNA